MRIEFESLNVGFYLRKKFGEIVTLSFWFQIEKPHTRCGAYYFYMLLGVQDGRIISGWICGTERYSFSRRIDIIHEV